jgi:hypothetical protein
MKDEYSATGKEVLLNGSHFADARNPDEAIAIAYAMNSVFLSKLGPEPGKQCSICKCIGGAHSMNCVQRPKDAA